MRGEKQVPVEKTAAAAVFARRYMNFISMKVLFNAPEKRVVARSLLQL
jgi:hypothetical protein